MLSYNGERVDRPALWRGRVCEWHHPCMSHAHWHALCYMHLSCQVSTLDIVIRCVVVMLCGACHWCGVYILSMCTTQAQGQAATLSYICDGNIHFDIYIFLYTLLARNHWSACHVSRGTRPQVRDDFMQLSCQVIFILRRPPIGGYVFC